MTTIELVPTHNHYGDYRDNYPLIIYGGTPVEGLPLAIPADALPGLPEYMLWVKAGEGWSIGDI